MSLMFNLHTFCWQKPPGMWVHMKEKTTIKQKAAAKWKEKIKAIVKQKPKHQIPQHQNETEITQLKWKQ